ncbi:MAG TPA: helix-turn-helix domain-containing protein [Egicoccus sp.]|nr:helix-turn-helix domain-containing protein [Egicoccus sp.]HSK22039.1 helix-turn-helix domain-containing protein [Egicoccus sp.]
MSSHDEAPSGAEPRAYPRPRRPATVAEAKAVAHPLRIRILRLCGQRELTNKELADRLGKSPGTVLYHVRQLLEAGLLVPAEVRSGASGALEKPYRSTGATWWLEDPLSDAGPAAAMLPIQAFYDELREVGPEALHATARFMLHLSDDDLREFERRILAILDEYIETDDRRRDQPAYGGLVAMHRLAD